MSKTRSARFLGGVFLGYANMAVAMVAGIWLTPFLLRQLGQHDYGIWLIGLQVLAYLSLLDFGVLALLPRETAYATGKAIKGEPSEVPNVIGQALRVLCVQTPIVILAALCFWIWMPTQWSLHRGPIGSLAFAFALTFPLHVFRAILEGLQDMKYLGQVQMASWAIGTATSAALVLARWGLYALVGGWVVIELIAAIACLYRLQKRFAGVLPDHLPPFSGAAVRSYLSKSFWVSISQVAQVLLSGTDTLVIGKLLGPGVVVVYACTTKLISVLTNQPQNLMQAAVPGLSEMKTGESPGRILHACTALGQAMLLLSGAVVCAVVSVNGDFVNRWVGPHLYGGLQLTALAAASMLLRHFNLVLVYTLFSLGHLRRIAITGIIDGVISTGSSLLLVSAFGITGAPLGSIVGTVLVSLTFNCWALCQDVGVTFGGLLRPFLPWACRFVLVALLAVAAAGIRVPTVIYLPLVPAVISLIYLAVNYKTLAQEPLGIYLMPRLRLAFSRLREARA